MKTQSSSATSLQIRTVQSPVGNLTLTASPRGLRAVAWPDDKRSSLPSGGVLVELGANSTLDSAALQIAEYFGGQRTSFDLSLDPVGTAFQLAAWDALAKIPYGETRSYAAQAAAIGNPTAVRAVGAANGRNPLSIVVPCHRVIGSGGSLTGFAGGLASKRFLLDLETRIGKELGILDRDPPRLFE